jgi:predicted RNA binding protein YcfA (HicA-like mRNA interferase family)
MPKIPRPTGKDMLSFLPKQGFVIMRIRGSHHIIEKGVLKTSIPVHGNQNLKIGTLNGILRDIQMTTQEFSDKF